MWLGIQGLASCAVNLYCLLASRVFIALLLTSVEKYWLGCVANPASSIALILLPCQRNRFGVWGEFERVRIFPGTIPQPLDPPSDLDQKNDYRRVLQVTSEKKMYRIKAMKFF